MMLYYLIIIYLFSFIYAQSNTRSCNVDKDCNSLNLKANSQHLASLGAYACINNQCEYVVKAGELCNVPQDCVSYLYLSRTNITSQDFINSLCDAKYCTLESNCGGAWDLIGESSKFSSQNQKCCGGISTIENTQTNQCPINGIQNVDTCANGYTCTKTNSESTGVCETAAQHYQTWIGVVLVLLGGSLLNFGLNLQKFALNRHEQKVKNKKLEEANELKLKIHSANVNENNISNDPVSESSTVFVSEIQPNSRPVHQRQKSRLSIESFKMKRTMSNVSKAASVAHTISNGAITFRDKILRFMAFWRRSVLSPLYVLGLLIYIGASGLNFVALQFAPQSLVGPLGSVALITNIILAPLMNKEKLKRTDFFGIAFIIGGCVLVVFFAGIVQHDYRLCVLYSLFKQTPTIIFLTVIFALILFTFCYIKVIEKNLESSVPSTPADSEMKSINSPEILRASIESIPPLQPPSSSPPKPNRDSIHLSPRLSSIKRTLSSKSFKKARECRLFDPDHSIFDFMVPKLKYQISRQSKHYKYFMPLAYASLGSLMATLTTLFAKTLINLLSISIIQGDNQFNSWLPWIILIFVAFTAFSQVYWIMLGLRRYDALLQVPVFYVIWTVFDIIGGGVYYNEFRDFNTLKYGMFILGVLIIFTGVAVLARRMSHIK